jgi:hypothetical protein
MNHYPLRGKSVSADILTKPKLTGLHKIFGLQNWQDILTDYKKYIKHSCNGWHKILTFQIFQSLGFLPDRFSSFGIIII